MNKKDNEEDSLEGKKTHVLDLLVILRQALRESGKVELGSAFGTPDGIVQFLGFDDGKDYQIEIKEKGK